MTPARKVLGLAVATTLLALPALGCWWTAWQLGIDSLRSRSWTPTPATVVKAGMHTHVSEGALARTGSASKHVTYEPWAVYEYAVNGRKYSSDRVSASRVFVAEGKGSAAWATREALVQAKEARQPYTVCVNPGDPSEVIANRSLHTTPFLVFLFMGLGAAAFYALVVYLILSQRRDP